MTDFSFSDIYLDFFYFCLKNYFSKCVAHIYHQHLFHLFLMNLYNNIVGKGLLGSFFINEGNHIN